jgi:hypothetical protein
MKVEDDGKFGKLNLKHIMSETKMENPRRSYLITKVDENNILKK